MSRILQRILLTLTEIIRCTLLFLVALAVVSPMIGTVFAFFDWYWGRMALVSNLLFAMLLFFFFYKMDVLQSDNTKENIVLLGVTAICLYGYSQYSPVLYIAQDPSVYMFKALNLVNYGHTYKPMLAYNYFVDNGIIEPLTGYGQLFSGTFLEGSKLHADFYPGGTFFYTLFGLVSKEMIFYAQTAIMMMNAWLMFFAIKRLAGLKNCVVVGIYTLAFMVAPLIVWFGRGSFAEPVALLFLLLIINILSAERQYPIILAVCFLAAYSARMDYLFIVLLGVFIVSYFDIKVGTVYVVVAMAQTLIYKHTYSFYYNRITAIDMPLLKYQIPMILIAFVISIFFIKWKKDLLLNIFYSKWVKYLLVVIGLMCLCLMFYDNVVPKDNYTMAQIHGRMLRTYEEEILDLIFLVFPSIIFTLGLVGLYKFIDKERINFVTSVFVLGVGIVYLYLLFGGANSPQLYWLLRRYYNNVVPITMLAFCCLFNNLQKNQEYLLAVVCVALSANLYLNSGQIADYDGLDKSVIKVEEAIKNQGYEVVYYPMTIKNLISPLFSYSDLDFVPLTFDEYLVLKENKDNFDLRNSLLLTGADGITDSAQMYEISYRKLGENYGEVPKEIYDKKAELAGYNLKEYMNLSDGRNVYPGGFINGIRGITDEWTSSEAEIAFDNINVENDSELVLEMYDYYNFYIDNKDLEGLNLKVIVNDEYELELIDYDNYVFTFSLDDVQEQGGILNKIKISSNTFCPADVGRGDVRQLGIAVKEINVQ